MARRSDRSDGQLLLGPRHGAEDGTGRRAYETYADLDPVGRRPAKGRFIDYPRRSRRGWTRWIPSWRLVLSLFLILVAALCAAVLIAYTRTELPSEQNVDATFQTTIVYDTHRKELGRFAAQNRIWTPLNKIPRTVQDAVIAAEDRTFRTNQGVSFTSVVRAALNNVRGGARQGGSTITQQYVKNAYSSTTDRTVSRKINEFFVSIKAAQSLSKDQILERYLNIIYFGRGCYGVEAAAQCYFNKPVAKLTPSEAAYLAGIVNGPELYDSRTAAAKAAATARWSYVLDGMASMGSITPQQRAGAVLPKVLPRHRQAKQAAGDQTEYLLGMIREEAKAYGITEQNLEQGGYRISTTFDSERIRDAERSLTDVLGPRKSWPSRTQAAIATIDARNGQVVSVYAGNGDRDSNAVTQDIAQAGSTFKPFALVAALEGAREPGNCDPQPPGPDSLSLRSRIDGRSPYRIPGLKQRVTNFPGEHFGFVDLVTATAHSVNTAYVRLNRQVGPQHTMDVAICAGYPAAEGGQGTLGLNDGILNVLGTSSPHPLDVASAFATFAAQGVRHDPYWIKSISKADGTKVVPERKNTGRRVFDEGVMADATYAMEAVVKQGTATYVRNLGRPAAGKTGTTSGNMSAWFAGFTPQYATVVTLYRLDRHGNPVELEPWAGAGSEVTGGSLPARVWTDYMREILKDEPVEDFPQPVFGGTTVNAAPTPSVTPSSAPSESESPSAAPTPTPTATPTPSEPTPSPSEPSPTPSATESEPGPLPTQPGLPRPKPRPRPSPTG